MPDQPGYPTPPPFPPPAAAQAPSFGNPPPYPPPYPQIPQIVVPQIRQGGGFARAIFTTLAVSVFGLSLTLNIYLLFASGLFSGHEREIEKTTLIDGDSKNVIAVLGVNGEINSSTSTEIAEAVKEIASDSDVKAVLVRMNTPGGEVTASDEIYDQLQRLKKENHLPVVVSMSGLATSGGYYIACAADKVYAERTTWTGNIGVLLPRYNLSKLGEKYGIEDATIKSTGADFKDAGSLFKPDTPEQTAYLQDLADKAFAVFKKVVAEGRKLDPATVDRIANGKVYSGEEAARLKLVDAVGYEQDAIDAAKSLAGLTGVSAKVVKYERTHSIFDSLGGGSRQSSQLGKAQLGPGGLSVDPATVREWLAPRPMYFWSGQ